MELIYLDAEHGPRSFTARVDGDRVLVTRDTLETLTGWTREPEGLCRGDVCVPVRDPELDRDDEVDLGRVAAAIRRPAVLDVEAAVAAIGERAVTRRGPIEAGTAPDFTLPTLAGETFAFSSLGRRKKLLLAWASW